MTNPHRLTKVKYRAPYSDYILIMGSNMAELHPVGFHWPVQAQQRGAVLIHTIQGGGDQRVGGAGCPHLGGEGRLTGRLHPSAG
jgi:hypothetical protein